MQMTYMAVCATKTKQSIGVNEQRFYCKIKGKLNYFMFTHRFYRSQKVKAVFNVFNHIYHEDEVKKSIFLRKIRCNKLKFIVLSRTRKLYGLRRDVIALKDTGRIHIFLQLCQNFACTTPYFADSLRVKIGPLYHF